MTILTDMSSHLSYVIAEFVVATTFRQDSALREIFRR